MRLRFIYRRSVGFAKCCFPSLFGASDCIKFLIILVYPRMVRHHFSDATDRYREDQKVSWSSQPRLHDATFPTVRSQLALGISCAKNKQTVLPMSSVFLVELRTTRDLCKKAPLKFSGGFVYIHPHFFPKASRSPLSLKCLRLTLTGRYSQHSSYVLNNNYFCLHSIFMQGIFIIWLYKQQLATFTEFYSSSVISEPQEVTAYS